MPGIWQIVYKLWKTLPFQTSMQKPNKIGKSRQTERWKRAVHDVHQSDDESWKGSDKDTSRAMDMVMVKSFNFNSLHSIIEEKI